MMLTLHVYIFYKEHKRVVKWLNNPGWNQKNFKMRNSFLQIIVDEGAKGSVLLQKWIIEELQIISREGERALEFLKNHVIKILYHSIHFWKDYC